MELVLKSRVQHQIADLLWAAQSQGDVEQILDSFGHDAHVVYQLMIAASIDEVEDTGLAQEVLSKFK